ncbi:MAG: HD domain-containing phosphohydrolase [Solirubrobacteraceae bacterium]
MASAACDSTPVAGGFLSAADEDRPRRGRPRVWQARIMALSTRLNAKVPLPIRIAVCVAMAGVGAFLLDTANGQAAVLGAGGCALAGAGLLLGYSRTAEVRGELEREIDDRSHELWHALAELEVAQAETVRRLSMAVELRDEDTGAHIERIGRMSVLLAEQVGLTPTYCARLSHAAPLHDVGKVAIPDAILLKPGPLTPEERAIVETHAEEGYRLLHRSSSSILELAATIALSHHERWDGSGYPRGLAREEIPIEGRIVAVADVFDALTSDRVYRKAYSIEEAVALMREQRGRHFDPELLDAFLEVMGAAGSTARAHIRSNPRALVAGLLEVFTKALRQGDPEMAEGAIAQAIEDGIEPAALHGQLIAPAIRNVTDLWEAGDIDAETEQRAVAIARRLLATLFRYMIPGTEPDRERVLLAGVEGDRDTLALQMAHDQLAAAGFHTTLVTDLSPERLAATIENQSPDVLVVGAAASSAAPLVEGIVEGLNGLYPELPVLLGGPAALSVSAERPRTRAIEQIERCVPVVEELLVESPRAPAQQAA